MIERLPAGTGAHGCGLPGPRDWPLGPANPDRPGPGEVHVWAASLDAVVTAGVALPLDERDRADAARFATPLLTRRCLAGRWMRRSVLARYLPIPARLIEYTAGRHGRPELAANGAGIRFSATDSGGLALLAITADAALGVDVELRRDLADRSDIVRRWFHPSERTQVFGQPSAVGQADVFFRLWTLKEAFVKALGLGLHLPLDGFAVDAGRADGAGLAAARRTRTGRRACRGCWCHRRSRISIPPPDGRWPISRTRRTFTLRLRGPARSSASARGPGGPETWRPDAAVYGHGQ